MQGDVIGCTLNMESGILSFSKNGTDLGEAYQLPQHLQKAVLYPALCLKDGEVAFNFGASPMQHAPSGATSLQQLPDDCLVSGAPAHMVNAGHRNCRSTCRRLCCTQRCASKLARWHLTSGRLPCSMRPAVPRLCSRCQTTAWFQASMLATCIMQACHYACGKSRCTCDLPSARRILLACWTCMALLGSWLY